MIRLVVDQHAKLVELCRHYQVRRLDVFGSAAASTFRPDSSDVDFIARFDATREPDYAERFYNFAEALQALFGRPVDLLTEAMIRNPYFREDVERTRQTVVELSHEQSSPPAAA